MANHMDFLMANLHYRCSDARDVGGLDETLKSALSQIYSSAGIQVHFASLSSAGSFMTHDAIGVTMATIKNMLDEHRAFFPQRMDITVQVNSHGAVEPIGEKKPDGELYLPGELTINQDSHVNCGMRGASGVWKEIVTLILDSAKLGGESQPAFMTGPAGLILLMLQLILKRCSFVCSRTHIFSKANLFMILHLQLLI
jgi:hypothetical protein